MAPSTIINPVETAPGSVWNAMQQIKNAIPKISGHDLVKLTSIAGSRTKGSYDPTEVDSLIKEYEKTWQWEQDAGAVWSGVNEHDWTNYITQVLTTAKSHNVLDWTGKGFTHEAADQPSAAGKTLSESLADNMPGGGVLSDLAKEEESITKVMGDLVDGHWWLRVAEGAVGIILIAIGIDKLFDLNVGKKISSAAAMGK